MTMIRDFSAGERTLSVEIDHSPVYELLLRLFVAGDEDCLNFEMGENLAAALNDGSATLRKDIAALGAASEVWISLISFAYEIGASDIGDFIDHIAAMDAVKLRTKLIDCCWIEPADHPEPAIRHQDAHEVRARLRESPLRHVEDQLREHLGGDARIGDDAAHLRVRHCA